jgi:hypothetical protein
LRRWANLGHNISLKQCTGKEIAAAGQRLNDRRAAAGEEPLSVAPRGFNIFQKATAGERLSTKTWDEPRMMRGLVRVIDLLEAGEHLSQRSIKRVSREHRATDDVPGWNAVVGLANRLGKSTEQRMREAERLHATVMDAATATGAQQMGGAEVPG